MRPEDMMIAMRNALKPGQYFRFHCDQCGDCCRHRKDIILTPFDLNRIARHFGTTPKAIVDRYCIVYIGDSSRFPVVLLKPEGKDEACPFLKENRCSIHKHKPTVCALFPLGRALMYEQKNDGSDKREQKLFYFLQDTHCGTKDETHTVKEWLGEFDLADSEAWFLEWSSALEKLSLSLRELEPIVPESIMQMVYNSVFSEVYLDYHGGIGFMSQFRGNVDRTASMLHAFKDRINAIRGGVGK